jgi:large subunit ribosomal protein L25
MANLSRASVPAGMAIKKLRVRTRAALWSHIGKFGPLSAETTQDPIARVLPNPFLPHKTKHGNWFPPVYSLRKQAEMVKFAKGNGLLHLLPPGPKSPTSPSVSSSTRKALQNAADKAREADLKSQEADRIEQEGVEILEAGTEKERATVTEAIVEARRVAKEAKDAEEKAATEAKEIQEVEENAAVVELKHQLWKTESDRDFKWLQPIAWEGKVKEKVRGAELGTTLYSGKKRMFKGHKWERVQQDRKRKQAILMRDMKKRIFNYKNVSCLVSSYAHDPYEYCCSVLQEKETRSPQTPADAQVSQTTLLGYSLKPLIYFSSSRRANAIETCLPHPLNSIRLTSFLSTWNFPG